MIGTRLMEALAMLVIGDSVLAVVSPRRHVALWREGPQWWERACEPLVRHAGITRALGAAGLGLGIWLAWSQEAKAPLSGDGRHVGWGGRLKEALR